MNKSTLRRLTTSLELRLFDGDSLLVKLLELLVVSGCPYCSAVRAIMFGYGVGIGGLFGLALVVLAVALNHLEKWTRDE